MTRAETGRGELATDTPNSSVIRSPFFNAGDAQESRMFHARAHVTIVVSARPPRARTGRYARPAAIRGVATSGARGHDQPVHHVIEPGANNSRAPCSSCTMHLFIFYLFIRWDFYYLFLFPLLKKYNGLNYILSNLSSRERRYGRSVN